MTSTPQFVTEPGDDPIANLARRHLWMHFTRHSVYKADEHVPIIVRGEGPYIFDDEGKRYFDGLSGLFTVMMGHGRTELADAAADQARTLAHFPIWSYATPKAVELAARLAELAPGDLNRVFFTSGGGEAVESAWKLAKQYFRITGKPEKYKVISRAVAYHGTPQGALSITGIPAAKIPFEPLVPGTHKVPNTNFYRAPIHADDEHAFGLWAAEQIAVAIELEGPESVAAVFLEPVQNSGGCFPPPPGYLQRVREICDTYDVLMVADETITSFGRIGDYFAMNRYGVTPDVITCAKGMTSGYVPMGAMIASDRLFEPFAHGDNMFLHGYTWGGHPVGRRRRPGESRSDG
ncbi:MAG: aspartate aminotransferase family protein [Candidatus Nanopelagicales bacterium]